MACGVKTNKGIVGMDEQGRSRESILEAAKAKGMRTGLVVTCTITHATPACFASHVRSRKMEEQIAEQLLDNRVNVMFGGGRKFFLPFITGGGARMDGRDLIKEAKEAGYNYVDTAKELKSADGDYVLGLFASESLTTHKPEPSLGEMTEKAIKLLSKEGDGFFLMVEGSQIDWTCHRNDEEECIRQVVLFDEAVKAGIDFAMSDGRTLVIATADHETGGLIITGEEGGSNKPEAKWTSRGHTGMPVAVYAFGPGAGEFSGVYDNTEIAKKIARLLGIEDFAIIKQAWESSDSEAEIFSRLYLTGVSK
jgi:alkaline phosphatase